jgi:hypothetical protein
VPQVYRKIERDLHDKKREMSNVIDITNLAREARDQARNEIAALRAQNDKEQTTFDAEFREVGDDACCGCCITGSSRPPILLSTGGPPHRGGPQGPRRRPACRS